MDREFACAVFAFERDAAVAEDRADVHDERIMAFAEQGQGVADELDRGECVDFEDGAEATGVGFGEAAMGGDAGVVDENIEPAELLAGGGEAR